MPVALGHVHRHVGVADQLVGVGGGVPVDDGDADARRDEDLLAARARTGTRARSRMRSAASAAVLGAVDVLEQDGELVAAEAGRGVAGADAARPAARRPRRSRSSPAAWPRLSLTVLKSSRSMKRTASPLRSRRARATAWRTRSSNSARLARPVSGSWNAWWASCSSKALRSLTSRALSTMPCDVLVVEQVRAEHLEAPRAAIAMPQHAVEDLRNGLGRGARSVRRCGRRASWLRSSSVSNGVPTISSAEYPSTRSTDGLCRSPCRRHRGP